MKALLLSGITDRVSLAVARSLGKRGIKIELCDAYRINPSRYSKYVSKFYISPNPVTDPDDMTEWLLKRVKSDHYDIIFPLNDYTYDITTEHQSQLLNYTNYLPNEIATYQRARDKIKTIELAREVGIPHPQTWILHSQQEISTIQTEVSRYPVVVKPAKSSGSRGLVIVKNPIELKNQLQALTSNFGPMLIQDYIPGEPLIFDVTMLFNRESEIRAAMVANRIRMFPDGAGPNTAGHGVKNDSLRELAIHMMRSIGWRGMCMAEFKIDSRDGQPKLIEINPRFGGSTQLGVNAGIDWPWLVYQITTSGDCETVMDYRTDILSRWLIPGDFMHAITTKNKKKLWPDFFKFFDKNTRYYIYNPDDPMPVVGLFLTMLRQLFNPKMLKYYFFRTKAQIKKYS